MCTSFKSNVSYALNSWPQHKAEMTPSEIELHIVIIHPTSTSSVEEFLFRFDCAIIF